MPYVYRDANGLITKVSARTLVGGECLSHTHPDITTFLRQRGQDPTHVEKAIDELRRTDGEMSRAIEDVIIVLLKKNLFKMSDLPKQVQDRMAHRIKQRVLIQDLYDQASGTRSTGG